MDVKLRFPISALWPKHHIVQVITVYKLTTELFSDTEIFPEYYNKLCTQRMQLARLLL